MLPTRHIHIQLSRVPQLLCTIPAKSCTIGRLLQLIRQSAGALYHGYITDEKRR